MHTMNTPADQPDANPEMEVLRHQVANLEALLASRNQTIAAASARERMYTHALDAISDMVLVKGAQSRIVYANRAFRDYYGMTNEQLADLVDAPFNEPDYTQQYIKDDAHVFGTGETLHIPDEPVTRFDGVVRRFQTVKSAIRDEAGQVNLTVGVSHDITEQSEAEGHLRTNEQLVSSLLNNLPAAVAVWSLDGRCLIANQAAAAQLAHDLNALPDRGVDELMSPEQAATWHRAAQQVLENGPVVVEEVQLERAGELHTFITTYFPIRDSSDTVTALGEITGDITALKLAEAEARRSAAYSEAILSAIPGLIFITSDDGDYLDYRTDKEELLLAPASSFLGKNVREVMPEMAEAFLQLGRAARATGKVQTWAFPAETPAGTRYFEGQTAALDEHRVLQIIHEVTERKQLEAERERLQEEIIQVQAAALAELSTPLIPLSDDVMVMPLVGSVDSRRAQQVLESLLEGVAQTGASIAILDITGVPVVDTQVANALIRAAQAVKLLGARVVLTGIRPEVAQTLVGLGAELGDIVTRGTLQSGIAYAMGRGSSGAAPVAKPLR
jgi:rsbT co-antagonist protein RsbR